MDIGDIKYLTPTKLKVSEAIRIGAKLRPQGFGSGATRFGDGTSCALQAGAEAITGTLIPMTGDCIRALELEHELGQAIYKMNDCDEMTREAIADWLEEQGH